MNFFRFALLALFSTAFVTAAEPRDNPVALTLGPLPVCEVAAGDTAIVKIPLTIRRGLHVNANPAATEDYIPLEVLLPDTLDVETGPARYPQGNTWRLEGGTEDLLVYSGRLEVAIPIIAAPGAAPGERLLEGTIEYQACDDKVCFMPESRPLRLKITVVNPQ